VCETIEYFLIFAQKWSEPAVRVKRLTNHYITLSLEVFQLL
jgi:hypothetical protein